MPNGQDEDDYDEIPADASNPLTEEKVELGKYLFHETGIATAGTNDNFEETWSCATCHNYQAGFKSGLVQAIGMGGEGFGVAGEGRRLNSSFDAESGNPRFVPDVQFRSTPSLLNVAYQDVMFWDGRFGNASGGPNASVDSRRVVTSEAPLSVNGNGYKGVEARAVAGWDMHGFEVTGNSVVQEEGRYRELFRDAYPSSSDVKRDTALAVAAYLRTLLPYNAPFQQWVRGSRGEMTDTQKRGAILFFGKAGCIDCHQGPALSSQVGASENEMFFSIGFNDMDVSRSDVTGDEDQVEEFELGRGGFTGDSNDNYKYKVPQLYNLRDAAVYGHGGSFTTIRDVVEYKNAAQKQNSDARNIADDFDPLRLTRTEINDLVEFLTDGLHDATLVERIPANTLPSGFCFPNNDDQSKSDLGC